MKNFSFLEELSQILSCMNTCLQVKYALFLSDVNESCIFLIDFLKKARISIFTKICPVGTQLLRADGQTDMTKLIVVFLQFCERAKR